MASDMNDKLELLKVQHASLGQNHMSMDADIVVPTFKAKTQAAGNFFTWKSGGDYHA